MKEREFVIIDGREVAIEGERNLLEVIRKSGIDLPTFCYHSELSVYGACRLCIVDIEGMGIVTSCSTVPRSGMKVRTNTEEIREMRKIFLELLLADHKRECPTCQRSYNCKLQDLARRMGVEDVRFTKTREELPIDNLSPSVVRDPNKCVLCGDCVRVCKEVQSVGAIDFTHRGSDVQVEPAFGKHLADVECVDCGQCARVCPTGALTIKTETESVWSAIHDPNKVVVAQIAPAVRVAIGEGFGLEPGKITTGQIVSALKMMGFDKVYDTSFTADLTVVEEATEFLTRFGKGERLPQFTSCCPGWVKFSEQYFPELLPNLSTCKSPQQMFGSLAKEILPEKLGCDKKDLVVVSIMPCTAKKFEAKRDEFTNENLADVDHVITTQELGLMISEAGIRFTTLAPESFDLPLGFKTGAGVIFGASGGVSEAVLRFAYEKVTGKKLENVDFTEVRNNEGIKEVTIELDGTEIKLAIVHSLANAREVAEKVKKGEADYHLIEVMACPGGCIGGAGQPVSFEDDTKEKRKEGLYNADKMLQLHKAQENPYIQECYKTVLKDGVGGKEAHHLLHTGYHSRKRITEAGLPLVQGSSENRLEVSICLGTNCYMKGSQTIMKKLVEYVEQEGLSDFVEVKATFCLEMCEKGPAILIGDKVVEFATYEKVVEVINSEIKPFMNA